MARTPVSTASGGLFVENRGQLPEAARFEVRGGFGIVHLADDALWVTVLKRPQSDERQTWRTVRPELLSSHVAVHRGVHIRVRFRRARRGVRPRGVTTREVAVSYFVDTVPHAGLPVWGSVLYDKLWPGVDLEVTVRRGRLLLLAHATDPAALSQVGLRIEGAYGASMIGAVLELATDVGRYHLPLPTAAAGSKRVDLKPGPKNSFDVSGVGRPGRGGAPPGPVAGTGNPPPFSTYLSGGDDDRAFSVAVDADDSIYVTGWTWSVDFPTTPGAFGTFFGTPGPYRNYAFVAKFKRARGTVLDYATFLGGVEAETCGTAIVAPGDGTAHVAGWTGAQKFPTTRDAVQRRLKGRSDAFYAVLDDRGRSLVYSTFLGGRQDDAAFSLALDRAGAAFLTGWSSSTDFPIGSTTGAPPWQPMLADEFDAFLTKLDRARGIVYSTYVGGGGIDIGLGVAVEQDGSAWVVGQTWSSDFPLADHTELRPPGRGASGFAFRVDAAGAPIFSTYVGGTSTRVNGVALSPDGSALIAGWTSAVHFPTTPGAYGTTYMGSAELFAFHSDAFACKLAADGSTIWSTLLAGSNDEFGQAVAVGVDGLVYIAGWTFSPDFPVTATALAATCGGDGHCCYDGLFYYADMFLSVLDPNGRELLYSTFYGGCADDGAYGLALGSNHSVCLAGYTDGTDFPMTADAVDGPGGGMYDAVVASFHI